MSAAAVGIVGTAVGTGLGLLVCANIPAIADFFGRLGGGRNGNWVEIEFITSAPARVQSERGADRGRDRPGAVARGGGLSGLAQHADRTGRGLAQ